MRARPACAALLSLAFAVSVAACGTSSADAVPPAPSASAPAALPAPSYTLTALGERYQVSSKSATNSCHTPDSGAWSYLYTGIDPFMTIDLTVYLGAAGTTPTGDFDLYFEFANDKAYQLTPSHRREEVAGDGTVTVTKDAAGATIAIKGSAEGRGDARGALTMVDLVLTCPS